MNRRKADMDAPIEFRRAVSVIMDRVTVATLDELESMLIIQNDLLKLTLNCINEKRRAHDPL